MKPVCILLVSFILSHFYKSSPTLLQVFQPLVWHYVECVIHRKRYVREEQHPYIRGVNNK